MSRGDRLLALMNSDKTDVGWMSRAADESRSARCPRAACGCVIVRNGEWLAWGSNGPIGKHCPEWGQAWADHMALEHCLESIHAEDAAVGMLKENKTDGTGATAYVYGHYGPCPNCRRILREAGITDIRYQPGPHRGTFGYGDDTTLNDEATLVTSKETITQEAERLIHGNRNADYGHPLEDFTRTGKLWAAILGIETVTPQQVALCMVALKISRQINRPKRDNLVDGCGYFGTIEMMEEKLAEDVP